MLYTKLGYVHIYIYISRYLKILSRELELSEKCIHVSIYKIQQQNTYNIY